MEANTLRAILLIAGVIILLGIYFADKLKKRPKQVFDEKIPPLDEPDLRAVGAKKIQPIITSEAYVDELSNRAQPYISETAPSTTDSFEEAGVEEEAAVNEVSIEERIEPEPLVVADPESGRRKYEDVPVVEQAPLIQLAIISRHDSVMEGVELLNAFTELKLEFGDMGIFHCYQRQEGREQQLFHIANMLEPGAFPVGSMSGFETKGVLLFMQAGAAGDSSLAFDTMLETARQLSERFNADLMDDRKQLLTIDKITSIQDQLSVLAHS